MSDQSLELHPECRELVDEISRLREELACLLTEEHKLLDVVKPNLLALYQQKVGAWELRRLQAQVASLRLKRRLELARAALTRGCAPDWTEIDTALEHEFLRWQQLVGEAADRLKAAEHRLSHLLAPTEDRELKKLYHALVKALHPDLHPHFTDGQRRLWHRVQEARVRCDLVELRALLVLAKEQAPLQKAEPHTIEVLRQDRDTLQTQIAEMARRITETEKQPPFTLHSQLTDDAWVASRRAELEIEIAQFESQLTGFEQSLAALLKLLNHGQESGSN